MKVNYDEFAFFNQQLAAMLRDGLPLEGSLRQLCAGMKDGALRQEMQQLEADLAKGTPLPQAIATCHLPEFYVRMVQVGVQGKDLPGMLTLLADYYQQVNSAWVRLKGLMVYPVIVLVAALMLSVGLCVLIGTLQKQFPVDWVSSKAPLAATVSLILPPVVVSLALGAMVCAMGIPACRRYWRWRLPGFKEASLSQFAAAMALMLQKGCSLAEGLKLIQEMEAGTPLGRELIGWQQRLAGGAGKFGDLAQPGVAVPPLFIWLIANAGEDLAGGFKRAAEMYHTRAVHQVEVMLYAFLPVSVMFLGVMIICQVVPIITTLRSFMDAVGGTGI